MRMLAGTDPASADAAWATADILHAAAAALGSRVLRDAADAYDRAARASFGRIPTPTPAGNGLRWAARLLAAYGYLTSDPSFRPIVLITRLVALVEAVAVLRQTHDHAAQAAGALGAAQRLHAAEQDFAASGACGCREPRPRHATRRYSLTMPPTRGCLRTRCCSRSTGSGSGFSGAAESSDR